MTINKKVIILGGGVGGLSAAHELIERNTSSHKFDIEIYEKDPNIPGGKARSLPVPNSGIGGRRNLPAEHGFRFFPGFYQHITDTMKRIPFRNDSVFHNLVDTSRLLIGRANHEPFVAISRFPQNLTDWEQAFEDYFKISETGLTKDDIHFFASKLWQILTSCDDRRLAEYEKICWWDFIEASSRSIEYQDFLANGLARSLTANNPHIGNTRTLGNIYLQLILGVFDPGSSTDRLLNGPTNEVWIDPWLSYLEGLGVKYKLGAEVGKVKLSNGAISSVQILYSNNIEEWVEGDYFIFSVPVEVMGTILENNPEITSLDPKLSGIITLKNDVAWMNGLMFYLNEDVPIVNGHQLYVNSPWSITAVSQAQFWKDFQFQNCGNGNVKGILSTDISNWEAPGIIYNKPACDLEDEKIKEEVWAQLKLSLNVNGKEILKDSMIETWYLDPDIKYIKQGIVENKIHINTQPLLVNLVNKWTYRPSSFSIIPNLFLASDYVRTNTDLACMEAANEAARRAVNDILEISNNNSSYCKIWELEEPLLFKPFKIKDQERFNKGLPWNGKLF